MREVLVTGESSPRLRHAAAAFGLWLRPNRSAERPRPSRALIRSLVADLRAGRIICITGPSGAGKSSLLDSVVRAAAEAGMHCTSADRPRRPDRLVADALGDSLESALALLADAGLAEASVLARRVRELSVGQKHRLALAQTLDRLPAGGIVLCDDFTAPLDRPTACSLAAALARAARRRRLGALLASTHDDIRPYLSPDVLVEIPLDAPAERSLASTRR